MRPFVIISAIAAFFHSAHWPIHAQETDPPPDGPNIFVELIVVAIPKANAVPLVIELNDEATRKVAIGKVREAMKSGTAKIIGWPVVTTRSGQRAVVEGIKEVRYATEYTAGGVGIYYNKTDGTIQKEETPVRGAEFTAVPSAFETRNVGVTLEVEPTLQGDGKTIALNIVPQHLRLVGMKRITIEREKTDEKIVTEQPDIDVSKVTTQLTMISGDQKLIGVFPTTDPPDHLELFLMRVEVRKP